MEELVLLIGNGINRMSTRGPSWSELLNNIQKELGVNIDLHNDFKPFPVAFEEIIMTNCPDYSSRIRAVKESISSELLRMEPNPFHSRIMHSDRIRNVLTVNYDYCFERVLEAQFSNMAPQINTYKTKEVRYSLRRKNTTGDKSIWHIHGELYDPKNYSAGKRNYKEASILIGYEHYAEAIKMMQDYKNGEKYLVEDAIEKKLAQDFQPGECWMDYFFTSEVLIMGIDLSFAEIDIWWLLNYRARYLRQFSSKSRTSRIAKNNKIAFCYPVFSTSAIKKMSGSKAEEERLKRDMEKTKARAEVLKAFDVTILALECPDYTSFYNTCFDKFKI